MTTYVQTLRNYGSSINETILRLDESTAKNEKLEKSSKSLETLVKNQEEKIAKQEKQLEVRGFESTPFFNPTLGPFNVPYLGCRT